MSISSNLKRALELALKILILLGRGRLYWHLAVIVMLAA